MARHDRNLGGCVPAALLTAPSYFFSLTSALASFLATRASFEKKPAMLSPRREAAGQPSTRWAAGPVDTFKSLCQTISSLASAPEQVTGGS